MSVSSPVLSKGWRLICGGRWTLTLIAAVSICDTTPTCSQAKPRLGPKWTIRTLSSHLVTREFNSPTNSPAGLPSLHAGSMPLLSHLGLDTGTVDLTVTTLVSRLVTWEVKSPTNYVLTPHVRVEP
eukprot:357880-Pyramimonas_sp.AAC.1